LGRDVQLRSEWRTVRALWDLIRDEQPDILHLNSSKIGILGGLLGRAARVPRIIFTAHGWAFNEARPWWQRLVIKVLHYATVLLSHRTIVVSDALPGQLRWPGAPGRMTRVYPGHTPAPALPRIQARQQLLSKLLHAPRTNILADPWVVIIAELHPVKQHEYLFEAFEHVLREQPNARLVCIGDGDQRVALEADIIERSLTDHIHLVGSVPQAARYLRAADVFVLPSRSEAFGYSVLEAAVAGVPVVASRVGGIPEIIRHEREGLLVQPSDVSALTTALIRVLTDQALRNRLGEAGLVRGRAFSVDQMVRQTIRVYQDD
jgi:glycosyltransferase involved in cell wall biosynthesis